MTDCPTDHTTTPRLNQLYFYLTDRCNLRCRHCWIEPHYTPEDRASTALEPDIFAAILDQAEPLGLTGVKLTGGEPLLHPRIGDLLTIIRRREFSLTVETNGTLCTPELARCLADFPCAFVSVSLDGAEAGTHDWIRGREGSFREAIGGIGHLVASGIRPQIIMTLMRRNKNEIAALVGLAESLGASSVKFNILQPTARGKHLQQTGEALDIGEMLALGRWVDQELSAQTTLSLCFHQPPAFRTLGNLFGKNGDGCQSCGVLGILGVLADGSYALCGIGATVPELIFGRAAKDDLSDVWQNNPILKDIRAGLPGRLAGICSRCILRKLCLGSCLAQNYYRRHTLWAPYWYCEAAFERGLFPETRLDPAPYAG